MGTLSLILAYAMVILLAYSAFQNELCTILEEMTTDNEKFTKYKGGLNLFLNSNFTTSPSFPF